MTMQSNDVRPTTTAAVLIGRPCPMHPERLTALCATLNSGRSDDRGAERERVQLRSSSPAKAGYEVRDGVALVPIAGVIVADQELQGMLEYYGVTYTDPYDVGRLLDKAELDRQVRSVLLVVDSPGGIIDGTQAAADAVWGMRQRGTKPVSAYTRSLAASAAYWISSQAGRLSADPTAEVGSIGVYTVLEDTSALAEKWGVRVHLVASGPDKGVGVPGTPISDLQLDAFRETIGDLAALFRSAVGRGRGAAPERVLGWASGRVWVAGRAVELGLIDAVESFEAALAAAGDVEAAMEYTRTALPGVGPAADNAAETASAKAAEMKETEMAESAKPAPAAPATDPVAEFAAKNPGAVEAFRAEGIKAADERLRALAAEFKDRPAFVLEQFQAGATVEQARVAHKDLVIGEQKTEIERLKAEAAKPAPKPEAAAAGAEPVGHVEAGAELSPEEKLKAEYTAEVEAGTFRKSFGAYQALRSRESAGK